MGEFGNIYRCEQVFSLMKKIKPRIMTRLADEHLKGKHANCNTSH
jgi:hypothetical protein